MDRGSDSTHGLHPAQGGRERCCRWVCWSDLRPFKLVSVDAVVPESPGTSRAEKNLKKKFVRQHFWCRCGKQNLEKKKRDACFFENSEKNLKKVFNGTCECHLCRHRPCSLVRAHSPVHLKKILLQIILLQSMPELASHAISVAAKAIAMNFRGR